MNKDNLLEMNSSQIRAILNDERYTATRNRFDHLVSCLMHAVRKEANGFVEVLKKVEDRVEIVPVQTVKENSK